MRVAELIAELETMPPGREVRVEGDLGDLHAVVGVHAYDGDGVTPERDVVIEIAS